METLAELAGVAASLAENRPELEGKVGVLIEDRMKYRLGVTPSEAHLLELEADITVLTRRKGEATVKAMKDGKLAVEGEIVF